MRYELRVTAYDMLDKVAVATVVLEQGTMPQISTTVVLRLSLIHI